MRSTAGRKCASAYGIIDGPPRVAVAARARAPLREIRETRHVELRLGRRTARLGRSAAKLRARKPAE